MGEDEQPPSLLSSVDDVLDGRAQLAYRYSSSEEDSLEASLSTSLIFQQVNKELVHSSPYLPKRRSNMESNVDSSSSSLGTLKGAAATPPCLSRKKKRLSSGLTVSELMSELESKWIGANQAARRSGSGSISNVPSEAELGSDSTSSLLTLMELPRLATSVKVLHSHSCRLAKFLQRVDSEVAQAQSDLGAVQDNLATTRSAAEATSTKVGKLAILASNVDRQLQQVLKEVQGLQERTVRTLQEAETSRDEFRKLKLDCEKMHRKMEEKLSSIEKSTTITEIRPERSNGHYESTTLPKMKHGSAKRAPFKFTAGSSASIFSPTNRPISAIPSLYPSVAGSNPTFNFTFTPPAIFASNPWPGNTQVKDEKADSSAITFIDQAK